MVKNPEFEERTYFGASGDRPITPVEDIIVSPGDAVDLGYEGKTVSIRIARVIEEQASFEGRVIEFVGHGLEHGDLKHGELVQFSYDKIRHIQNWQHRKGDQPTC